MRASVFGIVGGNLRGAVVGRPTEGGEGAGFGGNRSAFTSLHLTATGSRLGEEVGMKRGRTPAEAIGARDPAFSWAPKLYRAAMPQRASRFGDLGPGVFGGVDRRSVAGQPKGDEGVLHLT